MKHKNPANEYAFLMIEYEMPDIIKELQNNISEEELYLCDDGNDYGLEKECHVTLVPCLDNNVDLNELKKHLQELSKYQILIHDISKFECQDYDVLKCGVISKALLDSNKEIRDSFDTHSEYKVYKPHMTVAYMKHGMADKYLQETLPKLILLKPKHFLFSYTDDKGSFEKIIF